MTITRRQLLRGLGAAAGLGNFSGLLEGCSFLHLKTDLASDLYRKPEEQKEQESKQQPAGRQPLVISSDQPGQSSPPLENSDVTNSQEVSIDRLAQDGPLKGIDSTRNIMYLALDIERLFSLPVTNEAYHTIDLIREAAASTIMPEQQPEAKLRALDSILNDKFKFKLTGRIDLLTGEIKDQVTTLGEGLDSENRQLDCDTSSLLFIGIGEDLGWPVQGVRVPYHFFVRWALSDKKAHPQHPHINWDTVHRDKFMDLAYWVNYRVDKSARDNGVYMKSLAREQTISTIFEQVGRALRKKGDYEKAVDAYSRAIALDDTNVFAWINRGDSLTQLKRYNEAVASFLEATKRDPSLFDSYRGLSFAYQQLGRKKDAEEAAKTAEQMWNEWHGLGN
ncbi:tetratricopeptide repeat protein [Candidatus Woesearchaeota archaeon]|nr:tetratricopeptide repeat protein [Candidatus Woesearchaeota archaeon]